MSTSTKNLIEGLVVAVAVGALTAAGEAYSSGQIEVSHLKGAAIAGAMGGLLAWLRQSPIRREMPPPQDPPQA